MTFLEHASEPLVERQSLSRAPQPIYRCRDLSWLLVFVAYWLGSFALAGYAYENGNSMRLIEGMDDDGQFCGTDGLRDLRNRTYLYYSCLQYGHRHPTVCVQSCPSLSGHYVHWYNESIIECETRSGRAIPATTYPTARLRSRCVPSAATLYVLVSSMIDTSAFSSLVTGLWLTWPLLLGATICASLLALAWMLSAHWLGRHGYLASATITFALASLICLSLVLWLRARYLNFGALQHMPMLQGSEESAMNTDMSVALAVLATALATGVGIALWFGLMHRLLQAGGILLEAAKAAADTPSLLLVPLLLQLLLALLFAYWLAVAVLLASAGHPVHGRLVSENEQLTLWLFVYHAIGLLWTAEAILHLGFCAASGVVVRWYFREPDAPRVHVSPCELLLRVLCYSPGSFVIGSLIIIPGRVFRFFLEHCLHQAQTDGKGKPELRQFAHCCLLCCLDRTTRYLQYISHNSYIYVAVHDLPFFEGAKQAFDLTLRNIGQVAVLTAGERLLLTLAKLAVSCVCTAFTALAIAATSSKMSAIDNTNGALILTFLATFCAADAWMTVYDAAIEAVFLCYLVDQEENDGDMRPFYASTQLRHYMEKHRPSIRLPALTPPDGARGDDVADKGEKL